MTYDELEAIEAREQAATAGPWINDPDDTREEPEHSGGIYGGPDGHKRDD